MDLSQIKQIPILDIARQLGIEVKGTKAMCFNGHDKNTPSLAFYEKNNSWTCFGACGKGGDNISLIQEYLGTDFLTALKWFDRYGIDVGQNHNITRKKVVVETRQATATSGKMPDIDVYEWLLSKCGRVSKETGKDYLIKHGISLETCVEHGIKELVNPRRAKQALIEKWGYSRVLSAGLIYKSKSLIWPGYCLLFPFYDKDKVTYIQARLFTGKAKYINPTGIQKPLYNMNLLSRLNKGDRVHICEGVPDALAMASRNLNAVAALGATSFNHEWVSKFKDFDVFIVPDGDDGGILFSKKITGLFNNKGLSVSKLRIPKGKDASDVLAEIGKKIGRT